MFAVSIIHTCAYLHLGDLESAPILSLPLPIAYYSELNRNVIQKCYSYDGGNVIAAINRRSVKYRGRTSKIADRILRFPHTKRQPSNRKVGVRGALHAKHESPSTSNWRRADSISTSFQMFKSNSIWVEFNGVHGIERHRHFNPCT